MMFINSIFLPKTISDQTMPEDISGKIGNFSHLFSNVFHIVKDEQEKSQPFKLDDSNPESVETSQNELLKVSLLLDNQLTLDNQNISMIITEFLSKINQEQNGEVQPEINKINVNERVSKYFSLSKNEFIKEIKNIIESLNKGDIKSLENVEISLIANGQSIKINTSSINITELENWANEQIQSNSDFEIQVKSRLKKLAVDVESTKKEISKTEKPVEIISVGSDNKIQADSKSIVPQNTTETSSILKNTAGFVSAFEKPLDGLKKTSVTMNENIIKQKFQNNIEPPSTTKLFFEGDSGLNDKVKIESTLPGKVVVQNILVANSESENEFISATKNELVSNMETLLKRENVLANSDILNHKSTIAEKQSDTSVKIVNNESKVKSGDLQSDEILKNTEMLKQTSGVNTKETGKSDKKIVVKANQKTNWISINKNSVQEKIALNDLIEKTNVKEIDINVQKFAKTNSTNPIKIQNEFQSKIISTKENISKIQAPALNSEVKKGFVTNREVRQPTVKKSLETENLKTEKSSNGIIKEKLTTTKPELNGKSVDPVKVQGTPKFRGLPELFTENEIVKNEQNTGIKVDKSISLKIEFAKTNVNSPQILKENPGMEPVEKIKVETKDLEQTKTTPVDQSKQKLETNVNETSRKNITSEIKTEQKPVELKLNPEKAFSENELVEKGNQVLPKNETVKISVNNQQTVKEVDKANVKESIKSPISHNTNTSTICNESEKTELNSFDNSETALKNMKERSVVENLRTSLKESVNDRAKQEGVTKNQFENKNVKVDLMQRRVYSQIPPLEVISEKDEIKNIKNPQLNFDESKLANIHEMDDSVKSATFAKGSKFNNEKQVWVKVSLEKNDIENGTHADAKRTEPHQSKITIDSNNDGIKKDSDQTNFSEKESYKYQNSKAHTISIGNSQSTQEKPAVQNQTTSNQQGFVSNIKPEIKTEHNLLKSDLHSEETRFSSRGAEMIEKIKVISSGEMIREVYKVFESGEKQSIVLRLVPRELGSVKVVLDTINNVLTAKVEVENESVGQIIRNNVEQLKQNLLHSGVNVNSINISYHNPDQKQNGFQNHKRKNSSYLHNNDVEEVDESIITKKMGYNTYEYLA